MKTLLWLDDIRDPFEDDANWLAFSPIEKPYYVEWVKSYKEFCNYINKNGIPDAICFDHDLGDEATNEKSGFDCAKYLVNYCLDNNLQLPKYNIQSANPVGKDNINGILRSYNKHYNSK